jgi:hypothetical protein
VTLTVAATFFALATRVEKVKRTAT